MLDLKGNNIMKNYLTKEYSEKLAKDTLGSFIDPIFFDYINSDCPDIQSMDGTVGIEVVRAMSEYDGRALAFSNKYFQPKYSTKFLKKQMSKMKIYGEIIEIPNSNIRVFSPTKGLLETDVSIKIIIDKINDKILLFRNYDKIFEFKQLYVFCHGSYENFDIEYVIRNIKNLSEMEIIFFDNMDKIYKYEVNNHILKCIKFDMTLYPKIIKEALKVKKSFK